MSLGFIKIATVFSSVIVSQCVHFEQVSLDDNNKKKTEQVEEETGVPALLIGDGNLMEGGTWWTGTTGEDLNLEVKKGEFILTAKNVGPKYTPFGKEVGAVDFSGGLAIRVLAKSEGESLPVLAFQMDDFEGVQCNASRPTKRIHKGDDYREYYFVLDDKVFQQSWPSNSNVNAKLISKILFFINPGGPAYTGKLSLKEIQVISKDEVKDVDDVKLAIGTNGGLVDDFKKGNEAWWVSDGFKKSMSDSGIVFEANNCGPKYEAFGRGFPTMNVYNANQLRVRARIEGEIPPELRIDLKDPNGITTNARPATNRIYPTEDGAYKDYIFRFKDRFLQTYPNTKKVDGQRIVEMVCFINAGKAPWTGKIHIKKVEFEFTGEVEVEEDKKLIAKKDKENTLIDDFKKPLYSWWSDDQIDLKREGAEMLVDVSKSSSLRAFGRAFQAIDFSKYPVLKVTAKATKNLRLGVGLKDIDENSTEKSPVYIEITKGDYRDYYVNVTDALASGESNPKEILETIFFIESGDETSAQLQIKEIIAVKEK